jgi:hypothetical protein
LFLFGIEFCVMGKGTLFLEEDLGDFVRSYWNVGGFGGKEFWGWARWGCGS